jgi:hypothetical protein
MRQTLLKIKEDKEKEIEGIILKGLDIQKLKSDIIEAYKKGKNEIHIMTILLPIEDIKLCNLECSCGSYTIHNVYECKFMNYIKKIIMVELNKLNEFDIEITFSGIRSLKESENQLEWGIYLKYKL